MNEQILAKLVDNFDDFKERLIRIEEGLKAVNAVGEEVEVLKINYAELNSSVKSSHKRIDSLEEREKDRLADIKWLKRTVIAGMITLGFTLSGAAIVTILKLAF